MGEHELVAIATISAALITGSLAVIAVTVQSRRIRRELDTTNEHTIGQAVARLEQMAWHHEQRLDAVEMRVTEQTTEISKALFDQNRHLAIYEHNRSLIEE